MLAPVDEVPRLDPMIALGAAFQGHLALLEPLLQLGDLLVQFEESLKAFLGELPRGHGLADGTAGIRAVAAVVKAAVGGDAGDVVKFLPQGVLVRPHLHLADARVVDEDAALFQHDELPRRGGVAPLAGDLVDLALLLPRFAEQGVDQGRFAHPAGTDKGDGDPRIEVAADFGDVLSIHGAGDDDLRLGTEGLDGSRGLRVLRRGIEVALVHQDQGPRPAASDQGEVALHASQVQVGTRVGDHADDVHVGGEDLLFRAPARGLPGKAGFPGEPRADDVVELTRADLQGDPIPHSGEFGVAGGLVVDLAAHHHLVFLALAGEGAVGDLVVANEARRYPTRFRTVRKGLFEKVAPAEIGQGHGAL